MSFPTNPFLTATPMCTVLQGSSIPMLFQKPSDTSFYNSCMRCAAFPPPLAPEDQGAERGICTEPNVTKANGSHPQKPYNLPSTSTSLKCIRIFGDVGTSDLPKVTPPS